MRDGTVDSNWDCWHQGVHQKVLAEAVKKMNHRLRECIGYRLAVKVVQEYGLGAVTR